MDKKYHFVYLTTNLTNNKKYIGKHSTNNLQDGYMGSGKIIKQLIMSKIPLKREILQMCQTQEQAYIREKYWINLYDAYHNDNFYNLTDGGEGNSTQLMKERWQQGIYDTEAFKQKQSNIMKERMKKDINLLEKRQQGWNSWWNNLTEQEKENWKNKGQKNGMFGKHHSKESIEKNRMNQPALMKIACKEQPDLVFYGLAEAAKWCGLKSSSKSAISRCLKGEQYTAGKHPVTHEKCHWFLYQKDQEEDKE